MMIPDFGAFQISDFRILAFHCTYSGMLKSKLVQILDVGHSSHFFTCLTNWTSEILTNLSQFFASLGCFIYIIVYIKQSRLAKNEPNGRNLNVYKPNKRAVGFWHCLDFNILLYSDAPKTGRKNIRFSACLVIGRLVDNNLSGFQTDWIQLDVR